MINEEITENEKKLFLLKKYSKILDKKIGTIDEKEIEFLTSRQKYYESEDRRCKQIYMRFAEVINKMQEHGIDEPIREQ